MSFGRAVSILVPTFNEENYIRNAISSLIPTDGAFDYELIVLDGGSTDRTLGIIREMSVANRRIRLASNRARFQAAAMNIGARIAKRDSGIIIRADCHAEYPPDFVDRIARELRGRNAASVVVPMRAVGTTFVQRAIAAAQNSRLGNGGSPHRLAASSRYVEAASSRYVEHGHHAAFDRNAFLSCGGYDESFTHNEDAEFDLRLTRAGTKIWLCSELGITYFPRRSFTALAKQYFNHGSGRARTMLKHRYRPKIRQVLPVAALGMNLCSLAAGIGFAWPLLLPSLAYVGICTIWGGVLAHSKRDLACWASGVAAIIMHHSWAIGFVYTSIRLFNSEHARSGPAFGVSSRGN
jgi:succinoglycan biosynthesis protein ExoA